MTTPTLTNTMFQNTSHLNFSVPQVTATRNVATGTVNEKINKSKKQRNNLPIRNTIQKVRQKYDKQILTHSGL